MTISTSLQLDLINSKQPCWSLFRSESKEEKIEVEVQEEEDINDSAVNKAYIGIRKKKKYIKK